MDEEKLQMPRDGLSEMLHWLAEPEDNANIETDPNVDALTTTHEPASTVDRLPDNGTLPVSFGRYDVIRELGSGQYGTVYLARDDSLNRQVAVKVAHADQLTTAKARQTYLDEAQTLAKLDGIAGIPKVYDWGESYDGRCYLVSEYIEGRDLDTLIQERTFSSTEAARLVAKLAIALHKAHKQGLVHRDVKPANILLRDDGEPVIVDFGLALRDDDVHARAAVAGTFNYMSPEQADMRSGAVDGRADIYSLGAVLYRMITGQLPVRGSDSESLLERIRTVEPKPLRQHCDSIPKALETVCLKALSKAPADRYQTGQDFADALRQSVAKKTAMTVPLLVSTIAVVAILVGILLFRPVDGPRISEFEVEHWDQSGETPTLAGHIGDRFMPPFVFGDSVKVRIRLAAPSYVSVFVLSPNGTVQRRIISVDKNDRKATMSVAFPQSEFDHWVVNEGIGGQGFLVLASRKPPTDLDEIQILIEENWHSIRQQATGLGCRWTFNGEHVKPLPAAVNSRPRSEEQVAFGGSHVQRFSEICRLPQLANHFDVRGIMFEVDPQPQIE